MIKSLNIEAGGCNPADKQSTKDVLIHAVDDPNTKSIKERTECHLQCQEGYFDEAIGDKIPFKCVPNPDRTDPRGIKKPAPTGCQGACVIRVLTFSITLIAFGAGGCVCILSPITPHLFFTSLFSDHVLQCKRAQQ